MRETKWRSKAEARAEAAHPSRCARGSRVFRRALAASDDFTLHAGIVGALERGAWSGRDARIAYGTVAWLARERSEALPGLLEALRLAWDEGSRVQVGVGTWERDVDFEVPHEVQGTLFREHFGEDVYRELLAGWRDL